MKHLKTYENLIIPNEKDYILLNVNDDREVDTFLNTNIGQITSIRDNKKIFIAYNNIPPNLERFFYFSPKRNTFYTEIIFGFTKFKSSKNKEDLEAILATNKYNI